MARQTLEYSVVKRSGSPFWYYKLEGWDKYRSTGLKVDETTEPKARSWAAKEWKLQIGPKKSGNQELKFKDWVEPFFGPDCPHLARIEAQRRPLSEEYKINCRRFVLKYFVPDRLGSKVLGEIGPDDIIDFRSRLLKRLGATRTAAAVLTVLGTVFEEAVIQLQGKGLIRFNPCRGLTKIHREKKVRSRLTKEEDALLFESGVPGPFRTGSEYVMFFLARCTGLRRGEVTALTWNQVRGKYLEVSKSLKRQTVESGKRELVAGLPKSGKARPVYLPERVRELLNDLPRDFDLIFCQEGGRVITEHVWKTAFDRATGKCSLQVSGRRITPHSLRHTYASALVELGAGRDVVQGLLGHADGVTTDIYVHQNILPPEVEAMMDQAARN